VKRSREQDSSSPPGASSWADMASALIEFIDCSKLVVCIDLDHTIWDTSCFEHTASPYERFEESDPTVKSVTYTSRKDSSRCKLSLYPEAFEILDWCREKGIRLTICSKSQQSEAARGILTALDMWSYFQFPQIYNRRKSTHFKQLKECTDLEYDSFLFFDDDSANIEMCSALGVVAEKVDPGRGLTKEAFLRGLTTFAMRHMAVPVARVTAPLPLRGSLSSNFNSGSSSPSGVMAVTPPLQLHMEVVGQQFLNCRNLYRPYQAASAAAVPAAAVPAAAIPTEPSSCATGGLIPHRMSGIHLNKYKFLVPLDLSCHGGGTDTAAVSESSEPEDEPEADASPNDPDQLVLSF
jgi:magnesium-dependent phosphatase-1